MSGIHEYSGYICLLLAMPTVDKRLVVFYYHKLIIDAIFWYICVSTFVAFATEMRAQYHDYLLIIPTIGNQPSL